MVDMFNNSHKTAGMCSLVDLILWTLNILVSGYLLRKSYKVWKFGGASNKVTQEAVQALLATQAQQQQAHLESSA